MAQRPILESWYHIDINYQVLDCVFGYSKLAARYLNSVYVKKLWATGGYRFHPGRLTAQKKI